MMVLAWNDIVGESRAWDTLVWWGAMMSLATALNQSLVTKWFSALAGHALTGWPGLGAMIYPAFLTVAVAAGAPPLAVRSQLPRELREKLRGRGSLRPNNAGRGDLHAVVERRPTRG